MKRSGSFVILQGTEGVERVESHPQLVGSRRRIVRLYLTVMLLLSLMFTLYIWQSTKIVEIKIRLKEVTNRIDFLDTENAVQRAELSKFQSLTRIERVAKTDLGMVVPKKLFYIRMPGIF